MNSTQPMVPRAWYRVYDQAVGHERAFRSDHHYELFLERFDHHLGPFVHRAAHALVPTGYHIIVRIRSIEDLPPSASSNPSTAISRAFADFLSIYVRLYNRDVGRLGTLFIRPFRRELLFSREMVHATIRAIHRAPVAHGLAKQPEDWPHSSANHPMDRIMDMTQPSVIPRAIRSH